MRKAIFVLFLLAISLVPAHAQPESWPIVERCLAPTTPPEGWTFDGTLLMQGRYGIHSYNASWETPRVQIWMDVRALRGGALSPDGQWYAVPFGEFYVTESYNHVTSVDEIHVHSTVDDREYTLTATDPWGYGGSYTQIHWTVDGALLFLSENGYEKRGWQAVDPLTGESMTLPPVVNTVSTFYSALFAPSPDWQRAVEYSRPETGDDRWQLRELTTDHADVLTTFESEVYYDILPVAWLPDSSLFAAQFEREGEAQLALYDRNGQQQDALYVLPTGRIVSPVGLTWSADGRYLAFNVIDDGYDNYNSTYTNYAWEANSTLMLADKQTQTIIDTCLSIGTGLAWSPETNQLAFLASGGGQRPIQILGIDEMTVYTVGSHYFDYTTTHTELRGMLGWRVP